MSSDKKKDPKKKPSQEVWKPDESQIHTIELAEKPPKKKNEKSQD